MSGFVDAILGKKEPKVDLVDYERKIMASLNDGQKKAIIDSYSKVLHDIETSNIPDAIASSEKDIIAMKNAGVEYFPGILDSLEIIFATSMIIDVTNRSLHDQEYSDSMKRLGDALQSIHDALKSLDRFEHETGYNVDKQIGYLHSLAGLINALAYGGNFDAGTQSKKGYRLARDDTTRMIMELVRKTRSHQTKIKTQLSKILQSTQALKYSVTKEKDTVKAIKKVEEFIEELDESYHKLNMLANDTPFLLFNGVFREKYEHLRKSLKELFALPIIVENHNLQVKLAKIVPEDGGVSHLKNEITQRAIMGLCTKVMEFFKEVGTKVRTGPVVTGTALVSLSVIYSAGFPNVVQKSAHDVALDQFSNSNTKPGYHLEMKGGEAHAATLAHAGGSAEQFLKDKIVEDYAKQNPAYTKLHGDIIAKKKIPTEEEILAAGYIVHERKKIISDIDKKFNISSYTTTYYNKSTQQAMQVFKYGGHDGFVNVLIPQLTNANENSAILYTADGINFDFKMINLNYKIDHQKILNNAIVPLMKKWYENERYADLVNIGKEWYKPGVGTKNYEFMAIWGIACNHYQQYEYASKILSKAFVLRNLKNAKPSSSVTNLDLNVIENFALTYEMRSKGDIAEKLVKHLYMLGGSISESGSKLNKYK